MRVISRFTFLMAGLLAAQSLMAKTVHYQLEIKKQNFNVTGTEVDFALTVNGGIPAPTLEFTEGDDAEILIVNHLQDDDASIHWHGILLPVEMDGVPHVTTPPIAPGQSYLFRFKIRQHGTYWYHSHTNVQEQKGVYGAIVIRPKKELIPVDRDVVVVLSDWSNEDALDIQKNLKKDGDYYLYKKGTMRSWWGALRAGSLGVYLKNEWSRMGAMDLSDVGYDAFLINGKRELELTSIKPHERVRLRLINAAASTYFNVALGGGPMKVVSADGIDITPVMAQSLLMGMAETYDIIFTPDDSRSYELKATAQDGTGGASGWIGVGEKVRAPEMDEPDLYMDMDHSAHSGHSGHYSTAEGIETLTVDEIKAKERMSFPKGAPLHEMKLVLDGDMRRYVWHINGKVIAQDRTIEIQSGDVVRFVFENRSMMHHPMHLHGHFFRVRNQYGDYSPLKHTVDVPPMGSRTIEFLADEPGEWMLHCHNLYHLKSGMARVVKYMSYTPKPELKAIQKYDHHLHDHWYSLASVEAATNHLQGKVRLSQTWNQIDGRVESRRDDYWNGEGDLFGRRWLGNYLNAFVGGSAKDFDYRGEVGVGYLLPLLIESNFMVDHKGKLRLDLAKKIQWTEIFYSDIEYIWRQDDKLGSDSLLTLMYAPVWAWSVGFKYTGSSFGVGFKYQF